MLSDSVGKNTVNAPGDVKTVQQIINIRDDLRKHLPQLRVDGTFGAKTQAAINLAQSSFMQNPDGRIDPYGATIKKIWPLAYANPTDLGIRGTDAYGSGYYGAPRGRRTHDGTDYISIPEQAVKAPFSGKVVRISQPYASGIDATVLSGVEIVACDGSTCWLWYIQPCTHIIGSIVHAGTNILGSAKTLKNRYSNGIIDHVHVRIHTRKGDEINPESVIM